MNLRPLQIPDGIPGKVLLTAMPGSRASFAADRAAILAAGVDTVLCLNPMKEIQGKSIDYFGAIQADHLPWRQAMLPMPDFDVADDRDAWLAHIREIGQQVKDGHTVLIHCAAGIGRTGTAAVCLLMCLGVNQPDALRAVLAAGSNPEVVAQQSLIDWVGEKIGK